MFWKCVLSAEIFALKRQDTKKYKKNCNNQIASNMCDSFESVGANSSFQRMKKKIFLITKKKKKNITHERKNNVVHLLNYYLRGNSEVPVFEMIFRCEVDFFLLFIRFFRVHFTQRVCFISIQIYNMLLKFQLCSWFLGRLELCCIYEIW